MKLNSMFILFVLLNFNILLIKADEEDTDELTLRNQLFADVFLLKEGVDRLQISVEVLNKRFNNQMEILKGIQNKIVLNDFDSEEENGICDRIHSMFNITLKKQNILESRLITKLQDIQEDQTIRLDEILVKQNLNKICNSPSANANTLSLLSTSLNEAGTKIDNLEQKLAKLETLSEKLNTQQTKFESFAENQFKILQDINEKLSKNQQKIEDIGKDLTDLKNITTDVNKVVTYRRPKLPMEVILGLTSSNITTLK